MQYMVYYANALLGLTCVQFVVRVSTSATFSSPHVRFRLLSMRLRLRTKKNYAAFSDKKKN